MDKKSEIVPFHASMHAQRCTNYDKWYNIIDKNNDIYYVINYQNKNCSRYYEPWYIINSEISRLDNINGIINLLEED